MNAGDTLKIVRVVWIDASDPDAPGEGSWYSDKDVDDWSSKECKVVSVGYLKSQTALYVTLVADWIRNDDGTHTWGRPTKIPVGMVQSIETIGDGST